jgi:uncharacterized membrane protein
VTTVPDTEQNETLDAPSQTDRFVRGATEAIGGPLGEHASVRRDRFWLVARIIVALTCFTLMLHWAQKSDCSDGQWIKLKQYRHACYTDIVALYSEDGLSQGQVPYVDHPVEYPVLTGVLMGLVGVPVYHFTKGDAGADPYEWFYNVNALVLGGLAVATAGALLALRRRRPWDVAMFAASPALLLTATVNWDLLAVALAAFALYAWARRRPALAGVLIAFGTAAKLWPVFLLFPLVLLGWRARRLGDAIFTVGVAALTWIAVNLPFMLLYPSNWWLFYRKSKERGVDWGTLWYMGAHIPRRDGTFGVVPFTWLNDARHVTTLNVLTWVLFGLACAGIAVLTYLAPRRPRLAQLAFLTLAAFLVFSKVWSQQYVLWLLPLALLARPRWGAFVAWQAAEVCYFFAFDAELMGASGSTIMPEGVFILASALRMVTLLVLCGFVIRDILRPELDVVRQVYPDDPDGGVFDGAPDRRADPVEVPIPA